MEECWKYKLTGVEVNFSATQQKKKKVNMSQVEQQGKDDFQQVKYILLTISPPILNISMFMWVLWLKLCLLFRMLEI